MGDRRRLNSLSRIHSVRNAPVEAEEGLLFSQQRQHLGNGRADGPPGRCNPRGLGHGQELDAFFLDDALKYDIDTFCAEVLQTFEAGSQFFESFSRLPF